jgi:hypothetical protein
MAGAWFVILFLKQRNLSVRIAGVSRESNQAPPYYNSEFYRDEVYTMEWNKTKILRSISHSEQIDVTNRLQYSLTSSNAQLK